MMLPVFTIADVRSWEPCYDPARFLPEDWQGTALDILDCEDCPAEDRLWVVLREECIDDRTLRLFAAWCARQALALIDDPDPRSVAALDTAERFANGEATVDELAAAGAAAWDASGDASAAASGAAWAAAWDASGAAWAEAGDVWAAASGAASGAAWAAVWDAASAAWDASAAAWDAARGAAWVAAWDAASGAARDAANVAARAATSGAASAAAKEAAIAAQVLYLQRLLASQSEPTVTLKLA